MRAGRELDEIVAQQVLGYVLQEQNGTVMETTREGIRPIRAYSTRIEDAWEVVSAMGITLIPIEGGSWFALVGSKEGWRSPTEFMECLQKADFLHAGAAVTESAPLSICLAALKAVEKRISEMGSSVTSVNRSRMN